VDPQTGALKPVSERTSKASRTVLHLSIPLSVHRRIDPLHSDLTVQLGGYVIGKLVSQDKIRSRVPWPEIKRDLLNLLWCDILCKPYMVHSLVYSRLVTGSVANVWTNA
jgi:hypothetical protein